jgi:hypothetical protein
MSDFGPPGLTVRVRSEGRESGLRLGTARVCKTCAKTVLARKFHEPHLRRTSAFRGEQGVRKPDGPRSKPR